MKINIKSGLKLAGLYFKEHAPEILTGVGIAGMITTVILAVRETPGCVDELREKKPDTRIEEAKIIAKHYIWPVVTGTLSTVCLVSSCSESKKRNAALAAALTLTEDNFTEYRDKVKEMVGERKEEKIEQAIAEDHVQRMEVTDKNMIHNGTGQTLMLDLVTGQSFYGDIDWLMKKFIELNDYLQTYETMDVSDYCYILCLDDPQLIGHQLGWKYDKKRRIELAKTSVLKNDIPVFVIGHKYPPTYDFDKR